MIEIEHGLYQSSDFSLAMDFKISAGEFCAVLGPSGAGKTTLLSVLAGFEPVQSGLIILAGRDVTQLSPALRPVSMIFQDYNAFSHIDVWTNVALGISPALKLNDGDQSSVADALKSVGLAHVAQRKPGELSGGERQRIAVARVLVRNKPILFLDEPFAALDPGLRSDMLDLIVDLQKQRGMTVLLVTHHPEEAKLAADKILFISEGRVSGPLPVSEFFASEDQSIVRYRGKRL